MRGSRAVSGYISPEKGDIGQDRRPTPPLGDVLVANRESVDGRRTMRKSGFGDEQIIGRPKEHQAAMTWRTSAASTASAMRGSRGSIEPRDREVSDTFADGVASGSSSWSTTSRGNGRPCRSTPRSRTGASLTDGIDRLRCATGRRRSSTARPIAHRRRHARRSPRRRRERRFDHSVRPSLTLRNH